MKLLLDAHTLIWAVDDPARLGRQAALLIPDTANELFISSGTVWELSIKVGLGKLGLSSPFRSWINQAIATLNAVLIPITVEDADVQASLLLHHRDPFDRLLVAQAHVRQLVIVSGDLVFDQYNVVRSW